MEPAEESTKTRGRRALTPALTILITAAVVAGAGVATAADSATVYVTESGQCYRFTEVAGTPCTTGERAEVTVETGDTVTWDFNTGTGYHNVVSSNDVVGDPAWTDFEVDFSNSGTYGYRFTAPGVYEFVCQAHPGMEGSVTVEGDPVEPSPTATATSTPTPTPTPTASVVASTSSDNHTQTPSPGHGAKDSVAPRVQIMRLTGGTRSVKVRFSLSEPATVAVTVNRRGAKTALASRTLQAPAGTRTVTLRDKRFKPGSYTVTLRATDAMGNKATAAGKNVRLRASR